MFEVSRELFFSAAHRLRGYGGKCESLHGHNWRVRLCARARELDHLGMVIDFKLLGSTLMEILDQLDHKLINEVPPFDQLNPSAELIAKFIAEQARDRLSGERVSIHRCEVWESEGSRAIYFLEA
jgi:6-pyruvoyltetrahydropterin/6-carboxytetrahydropterin synthase